MAPSLVFGPAAGMTGLGNLIPQMLTLNLAT
jgi:hypothetical protein